MSKEHIWLLLLNLDALTENFIQVKCDQLFSNLCLHFCLQVSRKDPHDGLGGKPVLGTLLVVSLWHVFKHNMASLVNVVDDLSGVGLII